MPFEKGHKINLGNHNVGTKSKAEIIKREAKRISKMTIEELATDKVYKHLETIEPKKDRQGIKDVALPVYLKSKADKHDITGKININFDDSFEVAQ